MPGVSPSSVITTTSNRISRRQLVARVLMGGGLFAISIPFILSAVEGPRKSSAPAAFSSAKSPHQINVPLPTEDLHGREALEYDLMLLREGLRLLKMSPYYTGTFYKNERINGVLDDGSLIRVKGRHEPFGLYLKWLEGDVGRELLFVEGEYDGEMLVRLGGIRGRLLPVLKIDPNGEKAREKVRHHISHLSILNLARRVLQFREEDRDRLDGMRCELIINPPGEEAGCLRCVTEYDSPQVCVEYRKTIHLIDPGTLLPVTVKTYGWPEADQKYSAEELDKRTLLEHYSYSDLELDPGLSDIDFDRENPEYNLRNLR